MTQEPQVDLGAFEEPLDRPAAAQRLVELEDAVRARMGKRVGEFGVVPFFLAVCIPLRMFEYRLQHLALLVRPEAHVLHLERT